MSADQDVDYPNIYFRDIQIRPITEIPAEYAAPLVVVSLLKQNLVC